MYTSVPYTSLPPFPIITILDNNDIFKFVNGWIIQDKIPSLQNYWIG
jgi:hypothetical protein